MTPDPSAIRRAIAAAAPRTGPIPAGHVLGTCGHLVNVGFGPGRKSPEPCRDCTIAVGEMGITDPDYPITLYPTTRSKISFGPRQGGLGTPIDFRRS